VQTFQWEVQAAAAQFAPRHSHPHNAACTPTLSCTCLHLDPSPVPYALRFTIRTSASPTDLLGTTTTTQRRLLSHHHLSLARGGKKYRTRLTLVFRGPVKDYRTSMEWGRAGRHPCRLDLTEGQGRPLCISSLITATPPQRAARAPNSSCPSMQSLRLLMWPQLCRVCTTSTSHALAMFIFTYQQTGDCAGSEVQVLEGTLLDEACFCKRIYATVCMIYPRTPVNVSLACSPSSGLTDSLSHQ
jgi:hypothetical protein